MPTSPKEIVRSTWALAEAQGDALTQNFYARLFADYPQVRAMFKSPMEKQGRHLAAALRFAVANLDRPEALAPALRTLGARHVAYGVQPAHYNVVGTVLLQAFAETLGDAWTPDARQAWTEVYEAVAMMCLEGDAEARAAQSGDLARASSKPAA